MHGAVHLSDTYAAGDFSRYTMSTVRLNTTTLAWSYCIVRSDGTVKESHVRGGDYEKCLYIWLSANELVFVEIIKYYPSFLGLPAAIAFSSHRAFSSLCFGVSASVNPQDLLIFRSLNDG